jgi:hypothetical protein
VVQVELVVSQINLLVSKAAIQYLPLLHRPAVAVQHHQVILAAQAGKTVDRVRAVVD